MSWLLCFLVSASLVVVRAESLNFGDPCQTPGGTNGTCVAVKNCSYVRKIVASADYTHYDTTYLETLRCGAMDVPGRKKPIPLFCCPKFENTPRCGSAQLGERIHFGEETPLGEHAWAALLFYNVRNRTVPKCGGSLVSERYVVTAAHCTVDRPTWKLLYARFSEFNISSKANCTTIDDDEVCRQDYEVESIIPHPEYDMNNVSRPNDICILRLARDVVFTDYVRPICLPFGSQIQDLPVVKEYFTVTGWGETENASRSDVQLHVELPGLENDACNSVYKVANVTLTDHQLCVGGLNGSDSCRGDSGGPLMREVRGGWYLVGVVSFGARLCGTENLPGVYTNVAKYLDWMETVMFVERYL